ncbi:putative oxidoreductase OrdL-like protein [Cladobotryum mycophilum]|uniref:Oxidoreductase OrdL-like protein n=1 Tax=Cladobotryum mycophilum TaxID=491253 RepID=A0ABR0SZS6_9HYPO
MGGIASKLHDGLDTVRDVLGIIAELGAKYTATMKRVSSDAGPPVSNPTSPYWMQDPPYPELLDLQHDVPAEADVVVIGSGITSAGATRTLCELTSDGGKGPAIVVLEARQLCSGATARNGGHIKLTAHSEYARLRRAFGASKAKKMVKMQLSNLEIMSEVGRHIPQGEVRRVETVDFFINEEEFEDAKGDVEVLREEIPGVGIEVWDGKGAKEKFGVNDHVVGALSYTAGALWPFRLINSVWHELVQHYPNLVISTHTPVEAITEGGKSSQYPYIVHTSRGAVKARHVLHATNGYTTHLIPGLRGYLVGVRGHMTAQRPGNDFPRMHGNRSWSIIYAPGFDYVTQRPDGEDGSPGDLMLGGAFFKSKDDGLDQIGTADDGRTDAESLMHLRGSMATLHEPNWGAGGELKKAWSGIMGMTGDMLPFVGPLPKMKGIPGPSLQSKGG